MIDKAINYPETKEPEKRPSFSTGAAPPDYKTSAEYKTVQDLPDYEDFLKYISSLPPGIGKTVVTAVEIGGKTYNFSSPEEASQYFRFLESRNPEAQYPVMPSPENPDLPTDMYPAPPQIRYPVMPSPENPDLPTDMYPVLVPHRTPSQIRNPDLPTDMYPAPPQIRYTAPPQIRYPSLSASANPAPSSRPVNPFVRPVSGQYNPLTPAEALAQVKNPFKRPT
jgi:hypothetical protein